MPDHRAFWMVCRTPLYEKAKTEPRQRYSSLGDARRAAQKLAKQTDRPFTILGSIETVQPNDDQQGDLF